MGDLKSDLAQASEQLEETHISWVFLQEDRVLKLKKPVNFGFLDFSTLDRRRQACEAEVRLNQRLAPDVYRGVVPIVRDAEGRHSVGPASAEPGANERASVVDWAVEMKRLPHADRLDQRFESGRVEPAMLTTLARHLAAFHAEADAGPHVARFGEVAQIRANVLQNFEQAHTLLEHWVSASEQRELESWQLAFLTNHAELFEARVRGGYIRDGHGDLRLEHVYFDAGGTPTIIDCIEFNDHFRCADVCADIAFLSMDLAFHERFAEKERFLAAYADASGDHDLYALVDFYESYRAYVRAKVDGMRLQQHAGLRPRELQREARRHFLLSLSAERRPLREPRLIAVGGAIASGKSALARALSERLACPVLSSDRVRKQLLGVGSTTPLSEAPYSGHYAPEVKQRVYAESLRRARVVLASGRSVIVDASFHSAEQRRAARTLAATAGAPFTFIECNAPAEQRVKRLAERARHPSESDGRLEIMAALDAQWEPVHELPQTQHVLLATGGSLADSIAELARSSVI